MSKKAIGIDLGSVLSEVAIIEAGKPVVIVNEEGSRTTPSIIALKDGDRKVGDAAKRQMIVNPKETVTIIKRFMGKNFKECSEAIKHVLYKVVDKGGMPRVSIEGREYSPEELSSMILAKMKKIAEDYCGEEIKDAIITVPAYFNDSERAATKQAGELAGLNVLRIIAEPTAALLAANIDTKKGGKYMVTDFGGATLDNSVADISDDVIEILASNGDVYLGGTDIDKKISDYIIEQFNKENDIDLRKDAQAMSRVIESAEKAKIELSNASSTEINIPYITIKDNTPLHLQMTLTRAKFEQLSRPIIDKVISCAKKAMEMSKLSNSDLNGILLVGGSCRIPLVQESLEKEFGVKLIKTANLDTAVSEGAAIQANKLIGGDNASDVVLLDVTPLTMGIETMGGVLTPIVESNTTIPVKKTQIFSTAQDNQTSVTINVLQGNRPMASDKKQIGLFNLDGIMPAKRGIPQIEVAFDIDANGILKVSAIDKGTNKEQHITIQTKGSLTKEEIEKIKADAEAHAEEDKKAKETADTLNKGDSIVFSTEKMIEEQGDKLSEDDKKNLNGLVDKMKEAVKNKDTDKINSTEKEINEIWNKIAAKMYQQTGGSGNTNGGFDFNDIMNKSKKDNSERKDNDENVRDADYKEV